LSLLKEVSEVQVVSTKLMIAKFTSLRNIVKKNCIHTAKIIIIVKENKSSSFYHFRI